MIKISYKTELKGYTKEDLIEIILGMKEYQHDLIDLVYRELKSIEKVRIKRMRMVEAIGWCDENRTNKSKKRKSKIKRIKK